MKIIAILMIAAASAAGVDDASAQKETPVVRDAVYRGTLVCTKLPFISKQLRTAIEATVTGTSVRYKRPVVMANGHRGLRGGVRLGRRRENQSEGRMEEGGQRLRSEL